MPSNSIPDLRTVMEVFIGGLLFSINGNSVDTF